MWHLPRILSIVVNKFNRVLGVLYAELREFYPDLIRDGAISHQFGAKETENSSTEPECSFQTETGRVVMKAIVTRFANDESGATAIEYGLIAAIVGVGIIVGLGNLKDALNTMFNTVSGKLASPS
jgi:pilus assembly protein Flp/PilA